MKAISICVTLIFGMFFIYQQNINTLAQTCETDSIPERLVVIRGKMIIVNHPELGQTPASGGTIIFQKVGCNTCFVGTNADIDGNYKISVGDGKYKIIVRNPSSPDFDMLTPEQVRFIDTETLDAKKYSKQVFDFDIKIRVSK